MQGECRKFSELVYPFQKSHVTLLTLSMFGSRSGELSSWLCTFAYSTLRFSINFVVRHLSKASLLVLQLTMTTFPRGIWMAVFLIVFLLAIIDSIPIHRSINCRISSISVVSAHKRALSCVIARRRFLTVALLRRWSSEPEFTRESGVLSGAKMIGDQ